MPERTEMGLQPGLLRGGDPVDVAGFPGHAGVDPARYSDAGEPAARGSGGLRICILGEPASKANSRQLVSFGKGGAKRPGLIKSKKAREYEKAAIPQVLAQCRRAGWNCRAVGPMRATIRVFYATERPDLDESVILDVLQGIVYGNDRQVRERHVYHAIDRANPRAEILIEPLQGGLL